MKYVFQTILFCLTASICSNGIAQQSNSPGRPPFELSKYSSYYKQANDQDDDSVEEDIEAARKRRANTRQPFGPWPKKTIQETRIDIRETSEVAPEDRSQELAANSQNSDWTGFYPNQKVFAWAAPDIRYQPLYFEDVALERYGQTTGLHTQPMRSGINFFKSFVFLPNQMRHDLPGSCDHPLGFCRPGSPVPETTQSKFFGFSTEN